jgi:hypothetical protein
MTIDTLEYVKKLAAAGVERRQAEAHAQAVRDTLAPQLATKADIHLLRSDLDRLEQKFDAKFLMLQWMLGFNLLMTAGVLWRLLR